MKENEIGGLPMAEHILVGLSSAPSNARIILTAATMSKAFKGSLTALFVRPIMKQCLILTRSVCERI